MQIFTILKRRKLFQQFFIFFIFLFSIVQSNAQTLKTDAEVPVLDVCGTYQQFSVSVVKGAANCVNGNLKIQLPVGFEYESGSVKLNGISAQETELNSQAFNVQITFPSGSITQEVKVTFSAKALCDVIGNTSSVPVVGYEFTGCNKVLDGSSDAINTRYAVLRVNVTPNNFLGNVDDIVNRTIEIKNQGNGAVTEFYLEKNLGNGLELLSYDVSAAVALGWNVDFSNPNKIIFSGNTLNTGDVLSIIENVKIDSCELTPTLYEVYYGCTQKCTNNNVNGKTNNIVNLVSINAPELILKASKPSVTCFNDYGLNRWVLKNNGGVSTNAINFQIQSLSQIEIENGAIKVNSSGVNVLPASTANNAIITLPALAPRDSLVIEFKQYYNAPNVAVDNCPSGPEFFSTGQNAYIATFGYEGACAEVTSSGNVTGDTTYKFAGQHVGEIDIFGGTPFNVDYLFHDFSIPNEQLNIGDKFAITIELSQGLSLSTFDFKGIEVTNLDENKYEIVFSYGTSPWNNGESLNYAFSRLKFQLKLDCATADLEDLWYTLGGELRKQGDSCNPVVFKCNTTKLKGFCGNGPCPDGLVNGVSELKRTNVGFAVDADGKPIVGSTSTNAEFRNFISGDILEINQVSTVNLATENFTKLKFVVEKSNTISDISLVLNSGKVFIDNLPVAQNLNVIENSNSYELVYDLTSPLVNGQQVKLALSLKAGISELGLKLFPTKSYLINESGDEFICGRNYTATGLYVPTKFEFHDGSKDFIECLNDSNKVVFQAKIVDFAFQDSFFSNEYRSIFSPTSVTINVPENITMTALKVVVKNQSWLDVNNSTTISNLNLNDTSYNLDLSSVIETITGQVLGSANALNYLDEGYELEFIPTVTLDVCEPTLTAKSEVLNVNFKGTIVDGKTPVTIFNQTKKLEYVTGVGSLTFKTSNNSTYGFFTPDGTEVYWVTKIESEGSRNFNSVWFAKQAGVLDILSVQEVSDYAGDIVLSTIFPVNDIFRLGNFESNNAKYFLIKAKVIDCSIEELVLTAGYNCEGNTYPNTIADAACKINDVVLSHAAIENIIQTEIYDQFNGVAEKPNLCEDIWYTVQLHNGGDSKLDNLKITIPLNTAPGLEFERFEVGEVYAANSIIIPTSYSTIGTSSVQNDTLTIALPANTSINTLERIRVKVYFKINSCEFRSGPRHTISSKGINICDEEVLDQTNPSTKRLIIAGGSDSFPELRLEANTTVLTIDPVLTSGGELRANYSTSIVNSGEFGVNDAITNEYNVAIKLPAGWAIVGDPSDYLLPLNKVNYIGYDNDRGYVYKVIANINVGEKVQFLNVPLKYNLSDETSLTCDYNFGNVDILVYQNIELDPCNPGIDCSVKGIDQVLYESSIPMELPIDSILTITPGNQFPIICNPTLTGAVPTLADVVLDSQTNVFHLDWYENHEEATSDLAADRLDLSTPLVNGRTYYVVNRFVYNGACKSNIGKIKVSFAQNTLTGTTTTICDDVNGTYKIKVVLNGKAPFAVTNNSTGAPGVFNENVWTSNPISSGTAFNAAAPYSVTFTDDNNCTPFTVSGDAPVCCTLVIVAPIEKTVECNSGIEPAVTGLPSISKSCGLTNIVYQDSTISQCVNGSKSFVRTFTVTDSKGNVKSVTQKINIIDNQKPVFNGPLPANITVSCASLVPATANLSATDNCGNAVVNVTEVIEKPVGNCVNNYIIKRTYTATDSCGNKIEHIQIITVNDAVKPQFSSTLPVDITVSCTALVPQATMVTATDNCGDTTIEVNDVIEKPAGNCENNYVIKRTYTATDSCGNSISHLQIITVNDTIKPQFNGTLPSNITVSCDSELPVASVLSATDNCGDAVVKVTEVIEKPDGNCVNNYVIKRTYTATDSCGNTTSHLQIITVKDTIKPVFVGLLPSNVTVTCASEVPASENLSATDNCGDVVVKVTDVIEKPAGNCENNYVIKRTYTATDSCGNSVSHLQIITVNDTVKPTFIENLPGDITVSCSSEIPNPEVLTAKDNCGIPLVTFKQVKVDGSCEGTFKWLRTWTATDSCGNFITHTQTIFVEDKTAPEFTVDPKNKVVECDGQGNLIEFNNWLTNYADAIATDACSSVNMTYYIEDTNTICGYSGDIVVSFIATDSCGNFAVKQAVFIIRDTVAPVFEQEAKSIVVECNDNEDALNAWLATNGGAIANDLCSSDVTWTNNFTGLVESCGNTGNATVTFTATDACGNASVTTATFTVVDTKKPTLLTPAQSMVVSCDTNTDQALQNWLSTRGGATASDTCSDIEWSNNYVALTPSCGNTGSTEVVFTATDSCGNLITTTATFTIVDRIAPVVLVQAQNKVVESDGTGNLTDLDAWLNNAGGAQASDSCSDIVWTNNYSQMTSSCGATGDVFVDFTATDACGNFVKTSARFTIVDTTAPNFVTLPKDKVVECDGQGNQLEFNAWLSNYAEAVAEDASMDVTYSYDVTPTQVMTCGLSKNIIVNFKATDACGNSTIKSATFSIKDTTAPTITTLAIDKTVECDGQGNQTALNTWLATNGGAIATDLCGDVKWSNDFTGLADSCGNSGNATVTFTATDACGNTSVTTAIFSIVDTKKPTLLTPAQSMVVSCDTNIDQALQNWLSTRGGATASDTCSDIEWSNNYVALTPSCGNTGSTEVVFTATDSCGNLITTTATFTIVDRIAPVVLVQAQNKVVESDGTGNLTDLDAWLNNAGGAQASDSCSTIVWTNNYSQMTSSCGATGDVFVDFTATDACGNFVKTSARFTIVDTTAPNFVTLPKDKVVECDGQGNQLEFNAWLSNYAEAVAEDASMDVTYSYDVTPTQVMTCGLSKNIIVNFKATDSCGNSTIKSATFSIKDIAAPAITTLAIDKTVECDGQGNQTALNTWLATNGGAIANDLCSSDVTWTNNFTGLVESCGNTGNATVTFTATDACGNASVTTATFTVVDTKKPTLLTPAQSMVVSCDTNTDQAFQNWLSTRGGATASDTCSDIEWSNNYVALTPSCGNTGSTEVVFTATDSCGNLITTTATFTIVDRIAPVVLVQAQNKVVESDGKGNLTDLDAWLNNAGGAQASDSCSTIVWTNNYSQMTSSCGATGDVFVDFTATDACGNFVKTSARFTIVDTTVPSFDELPESIVVECDGSGNLDALDNWIQSRGGALATDINSTNVVWSHLRSSAISTNNDDVIHTVDFTVTDACGNSKTERATFTITDTTPPVISIEANDRNVECDGNGNTTDLTAWLNSHGGAVATDLCGDVVWTNDFTGLTYTCGSTGNTEVTFTATDNYGNSVSTTAIFTITDTIAPNFVSNLPQDLVLECNQTVPTPDKLNAIDSCSSAVVTFSETKVDGSCSNSFDLVRTWTATDGCGNETVHIQTITIQDTTAPEFVGVMPETDLYINCKDFTNAEILKAIDNCGEVTVTSHDEKVEGICESKYDVIRTWVATDSCGNETSFTQTIHLSCAVQVFNAVSPDGDGNNDDFIIEGINCYPGNTVEIYNRWGVLVYETRNYNSNGNTFKGYSEGRVTMSNNSKLPTGTYFYVIKYTYDLGNGQSNPIEQSGYLHLESN